MDYNSRLCYDNKRGVIMKTIQLTHKEILQHLPKRDPLAHKGKFGKILLLCGSRGYTGAAALAAMGALRCGAGLVYLGIPECIYAIEAAKLLEPIVFPLPDKEGMFSDKAFNEIIPILPKMDAVLIGPGMGCSEGTRNITECVLKTFKGTVVIDADGINVLSGHIDILRGRTDPTILTPHEGEFTRAGGTLMNDRVQSAEDFAQQTNSIVLLKGHNTVITDGKQAFINPTGNPGMAVGGSGDVLAGIITALLGLKIEPILAAAYGAFLHGAAGDICADEIGQYGMLPSDMIHVLPRLLK